MGSKASKAILLVLIALALGQSVHGNLGRLLSYAGLLPALNNGGQYNLIRFLQPGYGSSLIDDSNRIVGGEYARAGQFPFMAVVHRLLGRGRVAQCGGTIITSRWVLTAGHCIGRQPNKLFQIVFGVVSKAGIGYNYYTGRGLSMITNQAIIHPRYTLSKNDIGLIRTPREIPFSSSIQPIRLANENYLDKSFAERNGIVLGWGKDGYASTGTSNLKYAVLPIISNSECSDYWSVTERNICTAPGVGQDACQGDSGGPLIVLENRRALQVGIVSYGDRDCPSGKPGVFTRITGYIGWIRSVTQTPVQA